MYGGKPGKKTAKRLVEVQDAFENNYLLFQYRFVEFFVEHLTDISRTFRGDLQAMMVLALVGQVQIRAVRMAIDHKLDPRNLPPERLSINASRIADVTGIPRETVRRKLEAIEARGWVQRSEAGGYRLAFRDGGSVAKTDLAEIDKRALDRVASLFRDLEALVVSATATTARPSEGAQTGQALSSDE